MSMNILLIEDDPDLHGAIVSFLAERHCRVTACRSVAEADDALRRLPDRSHAPDAIVSDTDGLGLYMKARQRFPGLRLILTSAQHGVPAVDNPATSAGGLSQGEAIDASISLQVPRASGAEQQRG